MTAERKRRWRVVWWVTISLGMTAQLAATVVLRDNTIGWNLFFSVMLLVSVHSAVEAIEEWRR